MSRKLVIVGDSSFAEIAYEYFTHDSDYEVVAFAVERAYITRDTLFGLPVVALESVATAYPPATHDAFVALTYKKMNRVRARLFGLMKEQGYRLATYVSSKAFVWRNVTLGENVFVFEDNTIQPFTVVEDDVIFWSGNHIGHHSIIRKHCFISSHVVVSGHCEVKEYCFIGVNATIGDTLTIAKDNFIAQGTVIYKNTEADKIYKGNPAEARGVAATQHFKV